VSAAKQADLREPESTGPAVSAISRRVNTKLTRVVLRFTTLSNDAKRGSFVIDERGGSFGRDESSNAIAVPSDLTMEVSFHDACCAIVHTRLFTPVSFCSSGKQSRRDFLGRRNVSAVRQASPAQDRARGRARFEWNVA
jgi:hypothetical protein